MDYPSMDPMILPELSHSPLQCLSPADSDSVRTPSFERSLEHTSTFSLIASPPTTKSQCLENSVYSSSPDFLATHKATHMAPSLNSLHIIPIDDSPVLGRVSCSCDEPSSISETDSPRPYDLDSRKYSLRFPPGHILNIEFAQVFELGDELGAGGYGFVMTAQYRQERCEVAVKFIIKDKVPDHAWMEDELIGRLPTEVMLLSFIDHKGVVKCLDLYEDHLYFYLVQELHGTPWPRHSPKPQASPQNIMDTPSLSPSSSIRSLDSFGPYTPPSVFALPPSPCHPNDKILKSNRETCKSSLYPPLPPENSRRPSHDLFECIEQSHEKRLTEDQAKHIFAQVASAVYYLDSLGISHRDIKDENLVIDEELNVKLIDFGSAIIVDPSEPRPYYTLFYGTTAYASAEILRKKPYLAAPAEIWTMGVLLSYLLTGASPFPNVEDAMKGKITLTDCPKLSRTVIHLLRRCLDPNPKTRATIAEVKDHSWLQQARE